MPKSADRHAQGRKSVMVPSDWHAFISRMASGEDKPIMWYLLCLVRQDAVSKGAKCPPLPWEADRS